MAGAGRNRHPWRKALRSLRHAIEGLLMAILLGLLWLLPAKTASDFGGWVGRRLGPPLKVNRRALRHLEIAFPEMPETERKKIVAGMWDSLGRVVAEYPHLGTIAALDSKLLEVIGGERLIEEQKTGRPFILFSAHIANFELPPVSAHMHGVHLTIMARRVNNPFIHHLLMYFRRRVTRPDAVIPKGIAGGRLAVKLLDENRNLGLLIDQRASRGIALPLFGKPARTTLALAKMAIDYDINAYPARLERIDGARMRLTVEDPLKRRPDLNDKQAEAEAMMLEVNQILERWIRERPGDWLWLHRRWDRP